MIDRMRFAYLGQILELRWIPISADAGITASIPLTAWRMWLCAGKKKGTFFASAPQLPLCIMSQPLSEQKLLLTPSFPVLLREKNKTTKHGFFTFQLITNLSSLKDEASWRAWQGKTDFFAHNLIHTGNEVSLLTSLQSLQNRQVLFSKLSIYDKI